MRFRTAGPAMRAFVASLSAARFQDRSSLRCALSRHSAGTGDEQTL
jgi:hypothetical protein